MKFRSILISSVAVFCASFAASGQDTIDALIRRAEQQPSPANRAALRKVCREHPGTAQQRQAIDALVDLPSPVDRLRADAIPEKARKFL